MRFAPAEKNGSCVECVEICRQLNDAYADERREADLGSRSGSVSGSIRGAPTQAAMESLRSLVGGTEEDAERVDALLEAYRYRPQYSLPTFPPAALAALSRCAQHAARTGHWLRRIAG